MLKNKISTIYITRHGESQGNAEGTLQGQLDFPLTPAGEEQAKNLAQELKNIHFDAVFSSDLLRARKTAEIVALEHKLIVTTTQALRERNFGHLQGKNKKDLSPLNKIFDDWFALTSKEWLTHRIVEDVETGDEIVTRFFTFLREVAVTYAGKTILVVSHGDVMRTILVHLGWATHIEMRGKTIENGGYIVLQTDGTDILIKETKGIKKNKGKEYSWGNQNTS
jgi:broad specificity phosphatase PhoE